MSAGSIFNLFPEPPKNPTAGKTDLERLQGDWTKIGNDMYKGLELVTHGRKTKR